MSKMSVWHSLSGGQNSLSATMKRNVFLLPFLETKWLQNVHDIAHHLRLPVVFGFMTSESNPQ